MTPDELLSLDVDKTAARIEGWKAQRKLLTNRINGMMNVLKCASKLGKVRGKQYEVSKNTKTKHSIDKENFAELVEFWPGAGLDPFVSSIIIEFKEGAFEEFTTEQKRLLANHVTTKTTYGHKLEEIKGCNS